MELRLLEYFLAIVREGNISKAAEYLHTSQPNLTRQIKVLEDEIGKQLFVRGNRKITLTEAGLQLRKRAEEILELVDKTNDELRADNETISGNIIIGGGESYTLISIAKIIKKLQETYPKLHFEFFSADTLDVLERLDKGLVDFGILVEPADISNYNSKRLPLSDTWGLLMNREFEYAKKDFITIDEVKKIPLLMSKHQMKNTFISNYLGTSYNELDIKATYNLIYNASLLVKEKIGSALCLEKLINTNDSDLKFVPFSPKLESKLHIVWKKYQYPSKAIQLFLEEIEKL